MKFLFLLVVICAITIYLLALTKPKTTHCIRKIKIKSASKAIFDKINDFKNWDDWSPYLKDPNMVKTYSGAQMGIGAHYAWSGDKNVGEGEITITDTTPTSQICLNLHMIKPFEAQNNVVFNLTENENGDETEVSWELSAPAPLFTRVMSVFFDMDKMIGNDFEIGLLRLKQVVEK
jgi:Polyketide cyclase / dehydrase and lipid transport